MISMLIPKFSLEIFALFMLTGVFSTLLIPETKQKTLEELSNEDQEGFVRSSSSFFLLILLSSDFVPASTGSSKRA